MAATLHRFRSKRDRLKEKAREKLRQLVLDFADAGDIQEDVVGPVVSVIDNQMASRKGWTFVMIGPNENSAVVSWLRANSKRPMAAMGVWAILFTGLRMDTGEIVLKRDEIAKRVGIAPCDVSSIMTELASINAIFRQRAGRGVRYFMNPNVGTCLKGRSRDEAQAEAVQLTLV
jgi:hypothetical protein